MNWYAYCGNDPLGYTDPSGLIRVAFYDPTYEIYDANGVLVGETGQMQAWADDTYFGFSIAMLSSQDVLDALEGLIESGVDVTEVFFFDHSVGTGDPSQYGRLDGLEFGDETLWFDDGTMEEFFTEMKDILGTGVEYHSRHCYLGDPMNEDRLTSIAKWTQATVTGANGRVFSLVHEGLEGGWTDNMKMDPLSGSIVDLPDYFPHWGYRKAVYNPDGSVTVSSYSRPVNAYWGRPKLTY